MDLTFIIQGNIGAGKTTLLGRWAEYDKDAMINHENIDQNVVEAYYENPKLSYYTQLKIISSASKQLEIINKKSMIRRWFGENNPVVIDRTILGTIAFNFANFMMGNITLKQFRKLLQYLGSKTNPCLPHLKFGFDPSKTFIVFLETPFEKCMERIKERGRPYEQDMDIEYIKALEVGHQYMKFLLSYYYGFNIVSIKDNTPEEISKLYNLHPSIKRPSCTLLEEYIPNKNSGDSIEYFFYIINKDPYLMRDYIHNVTIEL